MPLREALILFGCLVVAIILHEISHGVAALAFGDDTAKRAGRLTLNPIPHIDPFGSIILPALGAISGLPVIGWAKPVPVNPARMRHPRRDIVFVSLAGPLTNFVLMAIAAVVARAELRGSGSILGGAIDTSSSSLLLEITFFFAVVNLLLGIFNLLPIPPLDGSALVERLLPRAWLPAWYRFRPYGLLVLFLLVFTIPGFVSSIVSPFYDALYHFVVS
ncbi:MAG TPA: site-2 protease family protein [Acidimicrobiia bacterium]|nr:site-2 protease family protein [Acidimicrobiia bacterium]